MSSSWDKTLLLVDDEHALRKLLCVALRKENFNVLEAGDGLEALTVLDANPRINVLITDIVMPKMDGLELVQAARVRYPALKVLLISGYAERLPKMRKGLTFLQKPFTIPQLTHAIAELLEPEALLRLRAPRNTAD